MKYDYKIARRLVMKQKIYNTIYGAVVADALGVPVEFLPRETLKNARNGHDRLWHLQSSQRQLV